MTPISVILGLPGALTDLCRDLCVDLAGRLGRPAQAAEIAAQVSDPSLDGQPIDCLGSLADTVMETGGEHVVAVLRAPDRAFAASVRKAARPFVVVLDDPRYVALEASAGGGLPEAIRGLGLSGACLLDLIDDERAVVLTPRELLVPMESTAGSLLAALGLSTDRAAIRVAQETIVTHAARSSLRDRPGHEAALKATRSEEHLLAVEGALGSYAAAFGGQKFERVVATRSLFCSAATGEPLDGPIIDATGRGRLLFYGPYLSIPAGSWNLRVIMAFSQELADIPFTMDATRGRGETAVEIGRISFTPGIGRYTAQITFAHREPDTQLEFRLHVDKAVFDGRVSLGYAELIRLDRDRADEVGGAIDWRPE